MKKIIILIIIILLIIIGIINISKLKNKNKISDIKSLHFGYTTGTMINSSVSYDLNYKDNKYIAIIKPNNISEEEAITTEISSKDIEKIIEILKKYNVQKWNGFNKHDPDVLDGNSFSISIYFKNNDSIIASGYMMYPNNYREVKEEFDDIFLKYYDKDTIK